VSTTRYQLTTPDGRTVTGAVQGHGGMLQGQRGMWLLTAASDQTINWFFVGGPERGVVRVYPDFCAASNGEPVDVPIAGAKVAFARVPKRTPKCRHDYSDGDVCSRCDCARAA
jgi:hypothetical protein